MASLPQMGLLYVRRRCAPKGQRLRTGEGEDHFHGAIPNAARNNLPLTGLKVEQ
jgi:hypothetical protein